MTDNPFAASGDDPRYAPPVSASVVPQHAPGALQVIAILCLILGLLGLLNCCAGGGGLAFMPVIKGFLDQAPATADNEFQKINLDAATSTAVLIPSIALLVFNLVVAPMLVIGSIGVLRKKESGRSMLRLGLLMAIVYNLLKAVLSVVAQLLNFNAVSARIDAYEGPVEKEKIEAVFEMTKIFGLGGAIVAAIFALALIGFYFWSRGYLNREEVIKYFASFEKSTF